MVVFVSFKLLLTPTFQRRHFLYGVVSAIFIFFGPVYAQDIEHILNDYKTATATVVGDWADPLTWEVWNGTDWTTAPVPPDRTNNVFIEKGKEVRLTQNEEVRNLYLYGKDISDDQPGKKLNLDVYDLDVYGELVCFQRVNDTFSKQQLTSGVNDWIYPETGNIVFRGTSRTVVDRDSWSASNQNSSYGVIFNPNPESTLTVNAAFKASKFIVRSGTVIQKVNTKGTPATSTFSFNTKVETSPGAYGSFVIENGATLMSEGSKEFNQIVRRSDTKPALRFELMEGGTLVLSGERPIIDAESIILDGKVFYNGEIGTQQFIQGSMAGVADFVLYNHIFFDGNAQKKLPKFLELEGDMTYLGGGEVDQADASIHFTGDKDQNVKGIALQLKEVLIDKPSGTLLLDNDLTISELFTMASGDLDFSGNKLFIYRDYKYLSGQWSNLDQLFYKDIHSELNPSNATFPFVDAYLGGLRKIILLGKLSSPLSDISIGYLQLPDVNWDPGFNDGDIPILYKLNSHFTFTFKDFGKDDDIEVQISANSLIVENDDHLRLVADTVAAPGLHINGTDNMAKRKIKLNELAHQILTIGSVGIASILPVTWLSYQAEELPTGNLISWSTATEEENKEFFVLKSTDGKEFEIIGSLPGGAASNAVRHYQFLDKTESRSQKVFYQIVQIDVSGSSAATPIFLLALDRQENELVLFPNPYTSADKLTLSISAKSADARIQMEVYDLQGKSLAQESGYFTSVSQRIIAQLKHFSSGIYFLSIISNGERSVVRVIKTD